MKKLEINRNHYNCIKNDECWQYKYMVEYKFSIEEIYKVCRKCSYYVNREGGIVNNETIEEVFKK